MPPSPSPGRRPRTPPVAHFVQSPVVGKVAAPSVAYAPDALLPQTGVHAGGAGGVQHGLQSIPVVSAADYRRQAIAPPPVSKRRRTSTPSSDAGGASTRRTAGRARSVRGGAVPAAQRGSLNGLKSFTMSVVAKLREYGKSSSYTTVSDELVADAFIRLRAERSEFNAQEVDKNIRRRVYDALNVLTSMGFVARSGKDVEWKGIAGFMRHVGLRTPPLASPDTAPAVTTAAAATAATAATAAGDTQLSAPIPPCHCAENARAVRALHAYSGVGGEAVAVEHTCALGGVERTRQQIERLRRTLDEKRARVAELRTQQASLQELVTRNASRDSARVTTGSDVLVSDDMAYVRPDAQRVDLPFLLVSTSARTAVAVEMEGNREDIVFRFDRPFAIHDGYAIVRQVCQRTHVLQQPPPPGPSRPAPTPPRQPLPPPTDVCASHEGTRGEAWSALYDGCEASPVTHVTGASEGDGALVAAERRGGGAKRKAPPCFALHRHDFRR